MLFEVECQCAGEAINPGQSGCIPRVGLDVFPIFFNYKTNAGVLNGLPANTVINQAWLLAKLNHVNEDERFYVFPKMENLASPPSENETEDISGITTPTGNELKQTITYEHVKKTANPALKAAYDSIKCRTLGVIFVTKTGQLNGMNDGLGNLVGIKLQDDTLTCQYAPNVVGQSQKMMISYLVDDLQNDANRDYIDTGDIAYPTANWFADQPIEVIPLEVSNSGTITFTLDGLYGGVNRKKPVMEILSADFSTDDGVTPAEVYNVTQDVAVGFTTVEDTLISGRYVGTLAVIAAPGDVIKIDLFKEGYHMRSLLVTMIAS